MLRFGGFISGNVLALFLAGWLHGGDQKKPAENPKGCPANQRQNDDGKKALPERLRELSACGYGLTFSSDGSLLATFSPHVTLWDFATGKKLSERHRRLGAEELGRFLVFAPDGKKLAAVYEGWRLDKPRLFIVLWDVANEKKLVNPRTLLARMNDIDEVPTPVYHVNFSPDSTKLVAGTPDGTLYIWETAAGKEVLRFKGGVTAAFSLDGSAVISISHDGNIRRWDATTGKPLDSSVAMPRRDYIYVNTIAFARNRQMVAMADDFTLCLKKLETGQTMHRFDFQGEYISTLLFSPDSSILAVASSSRICFLDGTSGQELGWFPYGSPVFTCDSKWIGWHEEKAYSFRDLKAVLANGEKSYQPARTDPPGVALEAELVPAAETYVLKLRGRTPERFSYLIGLGHDPGSPWVDLVLELTNTGDKEVRICPEKQLHSFYLVGDGAMNLPWVPVQLGFAGGGSEMVTLAPGKSFCFRVRNLNQATAGPGWIVGGPKYFPRYWLLPGDYTLQSSYWLSVAGAPKGGKPTDDESSSVEIRCSPIKLKVVEGKK